MSEQSSSLCAWALCDFFWCWLKTRYLALRYRQWSYLLIIWRQATVARQGFTQQWSVSVTMTHCWTRAEFHHPPQSFHNLRIRRFPNNIIICLAWYLEVVIAAVKDRERVRTNKPKLPTPAITQLQAAFLSASWSSNSYKSRTIPLNKYNTTLCPAKLSANFHNNQRRSKLGPLCSTQWLPLWTSFQILLLA